MAAFNRCGSDHGIAEIDSPRRIELLHQIAASLDHRPAMSRVETGDPAGQILAVARNVEASLIVVGPSTRAPLQSIVLGGVREHWRPGLHARWPSLAPSQRCL